MPGASRYRLCPIFTTECHTRLSPAEEGKRRRTCGGVAWGGPVREGGRMRAHGGPVREGGRMRAHGGAPSGREDKVGKGGKISKQWKAKGGE